MPSLAVNAKAKHDYEILEKLEAGIVLSGAEVKAAKKGSINLKGAFVTFKDNEAWITNMHIGHYAPAGPDDSYDPTHARKLLLSRKQLNFLRGKHEAERLTIVPLSLYTSRNLVKVEIALARGKRAFEKRDTIKKRDLDREMRREEF